MEKPTQRPRHRLGFMVVVQAGQIPPAGIAAKFDQAGAPNAAQKSTTRGSHIVSTGGAIRSLPRKIARKPISSISDSQPNKYQVWPTLTIDRYATHSSSHNNTAIQSGTTSASPAAIPAANAAPNHATVAKNRSE